MRDERRLCRPQPGTHQIETEYTDASGGGSRAFANRNVTAPGRMPGNMTEETDHVSTV